MGQPAWRKLERESQKEKAKGARPLNLYAAVTQELKLYFVNASALELFNIREGTTVLEEKYGGERERQRGLIYTEHKPICRRCNIVLPILL